MRAVGHEVAYVDGPTPSHIGNLLLLPWVMFVHRLRGYTIFHLHWVYLFQLPWLSHPGRLIMQLYFMMCLWWLKLIGFKLVWTVHNVLPHSPQFVNDLAARRFLAKRANRIIVHSEATIRELAAKNISFAKAVVVPQGNYAYPCSISRADARQELHLPTEAKVLLFFGRIEPYKNLSALLKSFEEISHSRNDVYLLIAGSCKDVRFVRHLATFQRKHGFKVQLHIHFIKDEKLQDYFMAADLAVFPFKEITTSATVMTALTFGIPVVAPRVGALLDIPERLGFWYKSQDTGGLTNAITLALDDATLRQRGKAAKRYAAEYGWPEIAEQTITILP